MPLGRFTGTATDSREGCSPAGPRRRRRASRISIGHGAISYCRFVWLGRIEHAYCRGWAGACRPQLVEVSLGVRQVLSVGVAAAGLGSYIEEMLKFLRGEDLHVVAAATGAIPTAGGERAGKSARRWSGEGGAFELAGSDGVDDAVPAVVGGGQPPG